MSVLDDIARMRQIRKDVADNPGRKKDGSVLEDLSDAAHKALAVAKENPKSTAALVGALTWYLSKKNEVPIATYEGKPVMSIVSGWDKYVKPLLLGAGTGYLTNWLLSKNASSRDGEERGAGGTNLSKDDVSMLRDYANKADSTANGIDLAAIASGGVAAKNLLDWRNAAKLLNEYHGSLDAYRRTLAGYEDDVAKRRAELAGLERKAERAAGKIGRFRDPVHQSTVAQNFRTRQNAVDRARNELLEAIVREPKGPNMFELAANNRDIGIVPARRNAAGVLIDAKPVVKRGTKLKALGGLVAAPLMHWGAKALREQGDELRADANAVEHEIRRPAWSRYVGE